MSGIILYDFVFFFVHWAMHDIPALRHWHAHHHECRSDNDSGNLAVEAQDVLRHGLMDGSLQVFVNIMVQRHTIWGSVKSCLARALHNVIVTWMLTEAHTASPTPDVFRRWFIGVRKHRLHHLGRQSHDKSCSTVEGFHRRHQQFFGYLDDLRASISNKSLHVKEKTACKLNRTSAHQEKDELTSLQRNDLEKVIQV